MENPTKLLEVIEKGSHPVSTILHGLKHGFITMDHALDLLNSRYSEWGVSEEDIVHLNVETTEPNMIDVLQKSTSGFEEGGLEWQYYFLKYALAKNSNEQEKLVEIEKSWSRLDYPEEWKPFIYYQSEGETSSSQELLAQAKEFLEHLRKKIETELL